MAIRPPLSSNPIRAIRRQRQQRLLATRAIQDSLISVAGLLGRPVNNQAGADVGTVADLVAAWRNEEPYPPVTGFVVRIGHRLAYVSTDQVDDVGPGGVRLRSARLDLRDIERREGEVMLARDVIDHQVVDVDDVQVIRAADLYVAWVSPPEAQAQAGGTAGGGPVRALRLVGVDVRAAVAAAPVGSEAVAQPGDAGAGDRLGRHPALRRRGAQRAAPGVRRSPAAAAPG